MGKLHISEDLFLEKQELRRYQRFTEEDGFRQILLLNAETFGIVKGFKLKNLFVPKKEVFEVTSVGSSTNNINVNVGRAIDAGSEIITLLSPRTINVPNTPFWYWVKIKYTQRLTELGTVSIDANGNLTGIGTAFREVLRGQPNFPSKIKFVGSSANLLEYEVVKVISDTSALLSGGAGSFFPETGLQYSVVGTFTPGFVPQNADKFIFRYDDCQIDLVPEDLLTPNVPPVKLDGYEFYIARVKTNGLNVLVHDKRTEFFATKAFHEFKFIERNRPIPNIGVESVKWDINTTTREKNEITVAWGFESTNWTIDPTNKKITINSGFGGKYKSTADFQNGDFNGWRLYAKDGSYEIIDTSQKSGTQINLFLEYLNPSNYTPGDLIRIVPNTEEITIIVNGNYLSGNLYKQQLQQVFVFKTIERRGKIYARIVDPVNPYLYNLLYTFGSYKEGAHIYTFPPDPVGHWTEKSFDEQGNLLPGPASDTDANNIANGYRFPYTGGYVGFVQLVPHPNTYVNFQKKIDLGDAFGVERVALNNSMQPVYQCVVGTQLQYQYFEGPQITLTGDLFVNLNKFFDPGQNTLPCRNGNRFYLHFKQVVNLNGFKLRIVQDYINPVTYNSLKEFDSNDEWFLSNSKEGLWFVCSFDGANWIVNSVNEIHWEPQGTIKLFSGSLSGKFDPSTGLGIGGGWLGWALCNGLNGTPDLRGRFVVGFDDSALRNVMPPIYSDVNYQNNNNTGNSSLGFTRTLTKDNLPPHRHKYFDAFVNAVDSGGASLSTQLALYAATEGVHQGVAHLAQSGISEGGGLNRGAVWFDRNTGDGTNNVYNQDGLKTNPDSIDIRPPFMVLAYVYKL